MATTPGQWSPELLHSQYSQLSPERVEGLKANPWLYQDASPIMQLRTWSSLGEGQPLPTTDGEPTSLHLCGAEPLVKPNNLQSSCSELGCTYSANSLLGQEADGNGGACSESQHGCGTPTSKAEHTKGRSDHGVLAAQVGRLRAGQSSPAHSDPGVQQTLRPHTSSGASTSTSNVLSGIHVNAF